MTRDEGIALDIRDLVYYGDDPTDTGVVVDNNGAVVRIRWDRGGATALHLTTALARVHRVDAAAAALAAALARCNCRSRGNPDLTAHALDCNAQPGPG